MFGGVVKSAKIMLEYGRANAGRKLLCYSPNVVVDGEERILLNIGPWVQATTGGQALDGYHTASDRAPLVWVSQERNHATLLL